MLFLEGLVGLRRTVQLLQHYWSGHRLWITVILNGLPWKRTEITLLFLRLYPSTACQTLVDHDGYSISSRGFLPTVVWSSVVNSSIPVHFILSSIHICQPNLPVHPTPLLYLGIHTFVL